MTVVGPGSNKARRRIRLEDGRVEDLPRQRLVCAWEDREDLLDYERPWEAFVAYAGDRWDDTLGQAVNAVTTAVAPIYGDGAAYASEHCQGTDFDASFLRKLCEATSVSFDEATEHAFDDRDPDSPTYVVPMDVRARRRKRWPPSTRLKSRGAWQRSDGRLSIGG